MARSNSSISTPTDRWLRQAEEKLSEYFDRCELDSKQVIKSLDLFGFGSKGPFPEFDSSKIIIPTIPLEEEDPKERINVIIDIFNANLPPPGSGGAVDQGFLHEIWTAMHLVYTGGIYTGKQISRPLTEAEKHAGCKGHSQMILVPFRDGHYREIDMLCEVEGKPFIVEAKNTKKADASQLKANVFLARLLNGGVMYSLAGTKGSQEKALRIRYQDLPEAKNLPSLQIIHIHSLVSDLYDDESNHGPLPSLIPEREVSRRLDLELDFGMKISYEDVPYYEQKLKDLRVNLDESTQTIGWAARALGLEG
jgi:hypothetical protein